MARRRKVHQRKSGDIQVPPFARAGAFSVHILTACGAGVGLLALIAAVRGEWATMFAWLGVALIIDGVDGTFARRLKIAERLPRWSGDALDLVVDFVTYVFVPAFALAASGLLDDLLAIPLALVIVISSGLYFADREMKTDGNYFRGFPALWNAVAFYVFLLKPVPWVSALTIACLAVLTFVPIRFIHPFRVARLRAVSIAVLCLWSTLALYAVIEELEPEPWVAWSLVALGLYFFVAGFLRERR
ncbi:MAG: phosphatidylcholine synthase [Rhizobiales bacterium]|nr:phosphatidylcholine synthase [Hyphomicrobiales bacterium]